MNISRNKVEHLAALARLELSDEEIEKFSHQLTDILNYAEKINQLDTGAVEPTAHAVPLKNVLREDEVKPSLLRETVLANAPDAGEEYFKVPKVIYSS
ncbi:MAG: Asp-tRNA(Asn)/Glu-tRNA(Gln) amidotransferase subunit GatC [bacterium]|nr:Asp-tRNA(Asn)/Glu-tRNA(Gln) amidotransferase subunit GatC [bacterium]